MAGKVMWDVNTWPDPGYSILYAWNLKGKIADSNAVMNNNAAYVVS